MHREAGVLTSYSNIGLMPTEFGLHRAEVWYNQPLSGETPGALVVFRYGQLFSRNDTRPVSSHLPAFFRRVPVFLSCFPAI